MVPSVKVTLEGFIDESGIVNSIPKGFENRLARFTSEADAKTALNDGKISAYYIITPDYMKTGEVIYVRPDFNPWAARSNSLRSKHSWPTT
jgi:hypothetical protein